MLATALHYNAIHIFVQKSVGIMDLISQHCGFQAVLFAESSEMFIAILQEIGKTSVANLTLDVSSLPQKSNC